MKCYYKANNDVVYYLGENSVHVALSVHNWRDAPTFVKPQLLIVQTSQSWQNPLRETASEFQGEMAHCRENESKPHLVSTVLIINCWMSHKSHIR